MHRARHGDDDLRHAEDVLEKVQEDQSASLEILVSADHKRAPLLAHEVTSSHSPRPQVRQHLHHRAHWICQDR